MLRRAIESVLAQTYYDYEIIVVSDASTDNTGEIVAAFADDRIKFLEHSLHRGASAARNTGIREARGRYIAFLDDDDEWVPQKLEWQLPVIENSPPEVGLVYGWMEYYQDGKPFAINQPTLKGDVFLETIDRQAIGGCPTVIIKREVIEKVGYFDEYLPRGNDGDFSRRVCRVFKVDYVPKVLARIHVGHKDRISSGEREGLINDIKAGMAKLNKFDSELREHPKIRANILLKIAASQARLGNRREAVSLLCQAFRADMTNPHIYTAAARTILRLHDIVK
jgi:glycosyltransferase involved in cell wall biosynthesis